MWVVQSFTYKFRRYAGFSARWRVFDDNRDALHHISTDL